MKANQKGSMYSIYVHVPCNHWINKSYNAIHKDARRAGFPKA